MNMSRTLLAAALLGLFAAPAIAADDSTTFNVKITITSTCDIKTVAATDVNFGSVASTATNVDQQGTLTVNCTSGTPYNIGLGFGQNGTDAASRKMKSGANLVPYQLYKAAARGASDVWDNTGTGRLAGTGTGAAQTVNVFGRVPSANFPAGAYNDVVTATVTY